MKIFVKIKPKAQDEKIVKIDSSHYLVHIKEAPEKGKANKSIIKNISEYFGVSKAQVKICSGLTSRQKSVEILSY